MSNWPTNGLALADSQAHPEQKYRNEPAQQVAIDSSQSSMDSIVQNYSDTDEEGENTSELFAKLYKLNQASKKHQTADEDPLRRGESAQTGESVDPQEQTPRVMESHSFTSKPISVGSMPSPSSVHSSILGDDEPAEPVQNTAQELKVIDETPSELSREPKVLSVWCKVNEFEWKPGHILGETSDFTRVMVRIIDNESTINMSPLDTRPLILDIGSIVKVQGMRGSFRVTNMMKEDTAAFMTSNHISKLEVTREGKSVLTALVEVDQIYLQEDGPPTNGRRGSTDHLPAAKRRRQESEHSGDCFTNCIFAITNAGPKTQQSQSILGLIVQNGGNVCDNFSQLVNPQNCSWRGNKTAKFGAVIAREKCQTPKFLEALAMGWPCLSHEYIYKCSETNSLLPIESFVISMPARRPSVDITLDTQFWTRKLVLGPILPPLYLLSSHTDSPLTMLLVISSGKQINVVSSSSEILEGSLVVRDDGEGRNELSIPLRQSLCTRQRLDETLIMSKEWLINCTLAGNIV